MQTLLLRAWRALPKIHRLRWVLIWMVTQKFLIGVSGVVLDAEGKVLLLRHTYRKEVPWGLPGGWMHRGEQPEAALHREIAEETGLKIKILHPVLIGTDPRWARLDLVYLCTTDGMPRPLSWEISAAQFFDPDSFPLLLPEHTALIQAALGSRTNAQ